MGSGRQAPSPMERDPNPLCHQLQKPLIAPVEGTGHEHFRSNLSVGRRIWPVQAASLGPNRSGAAPRGYSTNQDTTDLAEIAIGPNRLICP